VTQVVTRFAPSPTGRLHLGHAYSAILAHDFARERGGAFLLRVEDIDPGRSRPEHVHGIMEDLAWLGLSWDGEIMYQSERLGIYADALRSLKARELVYPCFCTRSSIAVEIAASASAPHGAPSGTPGPSTPAPFALSLSKGCPSPSPAPEERAGLRQAQPERSGGA
jgi:glutamyl-Q tRNA(Asp) synthetase